MCNPALAIMGASAIASASAARNSAKAQQQSLLADAMASDRNAIAADNAAVVADNNAEIANWQAREAVREGERSVGGEMRTRSDALQASRAEAAAVKSRQKVNLAANGVDVTSGSAVDLLTSTDYLSALNDERINAASARNVAAIRNNAINNAWGYRTQGTGYRDSAATQRADAELYRFDAERQRAGSSAIRPNRAAGVSLIGSAGQIASSWYGMGGGGK
jgi:hypothetical protein